MKPFARLTLTLALLVATVAAQTRVVAPKNKYTPQQDVQVGREAADEVRRQYPVINDGQLNDYLSGLGHRLVNAVPAEYRHPEFEYSFTPVNLKEINAFALPGGPMFVNRGMLAAATTEGEVAGVMAHELSHVVLRHGTANATKAQGFQIGAIAGAIAGAVIGGALGEVVSQGSQFGLGTWMLKYSREYERDADLLGTQIMARAGYDPRDLAHMFETIERQGGSGGPQFLSDHPNPGNRTQYINAEAQHLAIGARPDQRAFQSAQNRLSSLPRALSQADVERGNARNGGGGNGGRNEPRSVGNIGSPVPLPSTRYRTERGGQFFQISVPDNWIALSSNNEIKYVPQNGYGESRTGETTMTHGVEVGMARASSRDLRDATDQFVDTLVSGNSGMRVINEQRSSISGRNAFVTSLQGNSAVGGFEYVDVYTALMSNGDLFYFITVVPERDRRNYYDTFQRVQSSIRLTS